MLAGVRDRLPLWVQERLEVIEPLVQIAVILLLAWLLQAFVRRLLARIGARYQLPATVLTPTRNVLRWVIYSVAALMALERLGVSSDVLWTGITGFVTVAAVAFFAAWSVLSNLFSALLIFTTRPFREGDVVEVIDTGDKPGIKGRVTDIRLIYTVMEDADPAHAGALLQVPNTMFFQKSLRRWRQGSEAASRHATPSGAPPSPDAQAPQRPD